jgi:hypothetical protein
MIQMIRMISDNNNFPMPIPIPIQTVRTYSVIEMKNHLKNTALNGCLFDYLWI